MRVKSGCIIERHVYHDDGMRLVMWVMRPPGEGPFPQLIWNHGSRIPISSWIGADRTQGSTIDFDDPCRPEVVRDKWMLVFPEGRGYAGSDGPLLAPLLPDVDLVTDYLHGRAHDANAATRLIQLRPDAKKNCAAIGGVSHGGAVSLFAASRQPSLYRAVVIQATGICYNEPCGLGALETAASRVTVPMLIQHFVTDSYVPIEVSRTIARKATLGNAAISLKEYPGVPGEEGHEIHAPGNHAQLVDDYHHSFRTAFAQCTPR